MEGKRERGRGKKEKAKHVSKKDVRLYRHHQNGFPHLEHPRAAGLILSVAFNPESKINLFDMQRIAWSQSAMSRKSFVVY